MGPRKRDLEDDIGSSSASGGSDSESGGDGGFGRRGRGKRKRTREERTEAAMLGMFAESSEDEKPRDKVRPGTRLAAGLAFVRGNGAGAAEDSDGDEDAGPEAHPGLGMFAKRQGWGVEGSESPAPQRSADGDGMDAEEVLEGGSDGDLGDENGREDTPMTGEDEAMDVDGGEDAEDFGGGEEEDEDAPRIGLGGFTRSKQGLGLGWQQQPGAPAPRGRRGLGSGSTPTPPPERKTIGSSKAGLGSAKPEAKAAKGKAKQVDKSFAKFEKHTKGFASRMLEKMGWTPGQGLGKEGAGIVQPIDVQVRPKNQGLAYNNFKEQTKAVREIEKEVKERHGIKYDIESSEEEEAGAGKRRKPKKAEKVQAWKAGPGKRKVVYKTAQELLAEQEDLDAEALPAESAARPAGPTKIIDMTSAGGPRELEAGQLKSVSAAMTESLMDDTRSLPELRHNIRLLADLCQDDLLRLQKQKRMEDAKIERARREQASVRQQLEAAERAAGRMARVGEVAREFNERAAEVAGMHDPVEAMDAYSDLFARMERDMAEELAEFRLDELCIAAIVPWCQKLYSSWHPLEDPERGVAFFRRWRRLLMVDPALGQPSLGPQGPKRGAGAIRQMTPYESLLSLVWLPRVRQVISNEWDPRSPDELIAMLEVWYGSTSDKARLLPQWMFLNILDQLVTPKLERTLSHWNPRRDGQQVHTWIHPWLPVFGDARMQPLLDTVRQKMSVVLQDWKPSEDTALKMLEPWQEVFPTADMEALVTRIILPKLLLALRHELVVNPAKQDTKPIKWVLQWKDFLGPNVVAHALQTEFFPKWLWTLWQWLSHPSCNPAEVTQWYTVWKSPATSSGSAAGVFPADVLKHPAVAAGFRQGLDLMNRAMELRDAGVDLTKIPPPVPPPATSTSAPPPPPKFAKNAGSVTGGSRRSASPMPGEDPHGFAPAKATPKPAAPRFQASIHDVIEDFFASQDMTFLPVEGRVHEATGKPLWRVGRPGGRKGAGASVLAYLDDGVLYARNGDKWEPTAMEALAEKVMAM